MKKWIFFLMIIHGMFMASAQKPSMNDGPYVFYSDGQMMVESVVNGEFRQKKADLDQRNGTILQVPFPGKEGIFFEVPLKPILENESSEFRNANKILALSDIEGTFESFRMLLSKGGVINDDLKWIFGNGHLVINGDVFDRGEEVTACLWLIYKLEEEARAQGGHVHFVIGNHEIMNLSEDIRYVHPKYMETATVLKRTYMEFYLPNTELGMWLRTKNIMEIVGKSLFAHGGISAELNETGLGIKKINNRVRPFYDRDGFDSLLKKEKLTTFFNSSTSPFWYRGYFAEPRATMSQVDQTLEQYKVKRIVVGHTIMPAISSFYEGKVVAIDVNHHKGDHQALFIENDQLFVMDVNGKKTRLD